MPTLKRLHELEDEARYATEAEQLELARQYTRLLNELWKGPLSTDDLVEHETRRIHRSTGSDPFRAATIARNLINKLEYVLLYYTPRGRNRRQPKGEAHEIARKAAHAIRRIRPDLFDAA